MHTVGELARSGTTQVLPTHTPAMSLRQTPCLKRSRSVVADVGASNAFCTSTGYTVRQPLDTGVTVPHMSSGDARGRAAIVVKADECPTAATDASFFRPALAPLSHEASGVDLTHIRESSAPEIGECPGSACGLHQELTLATQPCEVLLEQENVARGAQATEPQNAVDLASPFLEDGEASVCGHAFVPSGASATHRSELCSRNELSEVRPDYLGSTYAVCNTSQAPGLGKAAWDPQQPAHTNAAAPCQRSTSAELVPWSPQKNNRHSRTPHGDHAYTAALVPSSRHGSHIRARSLSPMPDRRMNEVQAHTVHTQGPLSVAVQCGTGSFHNDYRSAVVHLDDLDDAVTSSMPRRQLQVVQQFVAESVVPTLAQCALTPAEHALVSLCIIVLPMFFQG